MKQYRYILEPYKGPSTRHTCPQCGKKQVFVRYIDAHTGQHIATDTGRCNRQEKCGYHKKPVTNSKIQIPNSKRFVILSAAKYPLGNSANAQEMLHCVQHDNAKPLTTNASSLTTIFKHSLKDYHINQLALYMCSILPYAAVEHVLEAYCVGTQGTSTVFWQIDVAGNIRGGKVMRYNAHTGKRIKDIQPAVGWMHTIHKLQDYELKQCLFGEHLLGGNTLPVALVESEKTALIASIHLPQYLWLATGGINNLTEAKCRVLHGRDVTLYPDAGAYSVWQHAMQYIPGCKISPLLERGFDAGSDIADWLLAG